MKILEQILKDNIGASVMVYTSHKLYGIQKIKLDLDYIFDEDRIGIRVRNGQEIFICRDRIVNYGVENDIFFADDLMEIRIKL